MEGSSLFPERSWQGISSTFGTDGFSVPITCMPLGKRLLTSDAKGESKQSCVILSFYFMSLAATIHDGRVSPIHSCLLCITVFSYLGTSITATHMYNNIAFVSLSLAKGRFQCKHTNFLSFSRNILPFSVWKSNYFTQKSSEYAFGREQE